MKGIMIFLFTFLFIQSAMGLDKTYFRTDYGLATFTSEKLDLLNTNPKGTTMGFAFGKRIDYMELGFFYKSSSLSAEINHDGAANKIIHDGTSFGLDLSFFINQHLSVKAGYSFNRYKQKTETLVNATATNAIKTIYGLQEDFTTSNVYFGSAIDIFATPTYDVYVSANYFPMSNGANLMSAQLGIRIYMNAGFTDFFGSN